MDEQKPFIYIIEDEESISKLICLYLNKSDMTTKAFFNAEDAVADLNENGNKFFPDLIILDLNLPGMSGFDFLKQMKEKYQNKLPPVVILSARDADEDIINGLGIGADEFITKPFSPSVLVARIKANLRRQINANAKAEESVCFGDYTLLLNSCVLKKGNTKVPLSTKEYGVLEYMLKNAGKILSPEDIYQNVWKLVYGDITAVAVYIQRLRKKIEDDPVNPVYLKTEFGKGYLFPKEQIK